MPAILSFLLLSTIRLLIIIISISINNKPAVFFFSSNKQCDFVNVGGYIVHAWSATIKQTV